MRALTLCEPYASAVVFGPKRIENRPVRFKHRGPLAIHAGRSRSWFSLEAISLLHREWPGFPASDVAALNYLHPRMGKVIGVVDVVDCYVARAGADPCRSVFEFGPYCMLFQRPRALRWPFWLRGQQGLMHVSDELIEKAEPVDVPAGSTFQWKVPMSLAGNARITEDARA